MNVGGGNFGCVVMVICGREGNDPDDSRVVTYAELLKEVCKFANVLKAQGWWSGGVGDCVVIFG